MMAVKKGSAFENLKNSFSLFRVPEEDASAAEKSPPIDDESTESGEKDVEVKEHYK
jgi:hypothetical protein